MADDGFYVEDESIEQVRVAVRRGEKGETRGKRDLNQRAKAIVDQAVARLEAPDVDKGIVISGNFLRQPTDEDKRFVLEVSA